MKLSSKTIRTIVIVLLVAFTVLSSACKPSPTTSVDQSTNAGDIIGSSIISDTADAAEKAGNFFCDLPGTDPNSQACQD